MERNILSATRRSVTGYITTADYVGEISKIVAGDTVYTAYFSGEEVIPEPLPFPVQELEPVPIPEAVPELKITEGSSEGADRNLQIPALIFFAILAAVACAAAFFCLHHNVRIYREDFKMLIAKDKVSTRKPTIDISALSDKYNDISYELEISRFTAKILNGKTIRIVYGPSKLQHSVAYEGNAYRIKVDFGSGSVQAVYK